MVVKILEKSCKNSVKSLIDSQKNYLIAYCSHLYPLLDLLNYIACH